MIFHNNEKIFITLVIIVIMTTTTTTTTTTIIIIIATTIITITLIRHRKFRGQGMRELFCKGDTSMEKRWSW